jgi:acid phosphatase type 7
MNKLKHILGIGALSVAFIASLAFTNAPTPKVEAAIDGSVTIAVVGDISCATNPCADTETAALIQNHIPAVDQAWLPGDLQYENGSLALFNSEFNDTYGSMGIPLKPVPGNHEYKTAGAAGYFSYFSGLSFTQSPGYYAFNINGWRIYALNSNCSKIDCAAQRAWMKADIAANGSNTTCEAMFYHHPRFSSGEHGSTSIMRRYWAEAQTTAGRFELALQGHDHNYERFTRMRADGTISDTGIQSFVSGLGGKSIRGFGTPVNGSQVRYAGDNGVLFLELAPSSYAWEFRNTSNNVIDSGSETCR